MSTSVLQARLGPLSFLINVNDLPNKCTNLSDISLLVDGKN